MMFAYHICKIMHETRATKWKKTKYELDAKSKDPIDLPLPLNTSKNPLVTDPLDTSLFFPKMEGSTGWNGWGGSKEPIIEGAVGNRTVDSSGGASATTSTFPGRTGTKLASLSYNINLFVNNSSVNSVFKNNGSGYIPNGYVIDASFENMPIYYWNHIYSSMNEDEIKARRTENQLNSYLLDAFKIDASGNLIPTYNDSGKFNIVDAFYYAKKNLDPKWKSPDKDQKFIDYAMLTDITGLYAAGTPSNGQETIETFTTDAWRRAYSILVYKMTWIDAPIQSTFDTSATQIKTVEDLDASGGKLISYEYDPNMPYFYWNHLYDKMTEGEKSAICTENYMNYYLLHGLVYDCGNGQINDFYMGNGTPLTSKGSPNLIPDLIQQMVNQIAVLDPSFHSLDPDQAKIDSKMRTFLEAAKSATDPSGTAMSSIEEAYSILVNKMVKNRIRLFSTGTKNKIGNVKKTSRIIEGFDTLGTIGGVTFNIDNSATNQNSANGQLKMPMGSYNSGSYFINNPETYAIPNNPNGSGNVLDQINNLYVPDLFGATDASGNSTGDGGGPAGQTMGSLITVANYIIGFILLPLFSMQQFIQIITDSICDGITGNATLNDKVCVYDCATMVVTYFLCIYIFLNWYYLLRYRENGVPIKLYDISWKRLHESSVVLGFFFKYLMCQVSFINACIVLIQKYCEYAERHIWMIIQFLITVVAVVYFGFSSEIFNLLMGSGAIAKGLCIAYMFIFAGYSFAIQDPVLKQIQYSSIVGIVLTMIIFILRIIFSILVVFIAITLIGLYLFVYSYFGILLYSKTSFTEAVRKMYEFWILGFEATNPFKYTECRRRSWYEFFVDTFKLIGRTLTANLFVFVFLLMFIYITYLYFNVLDNMSLAAILIIFNLFVIGYLINYLFNGAPQFAADIKVISKVENALGVSGAAEPRDQIPTIAGNFQNIRTPQEQARFDALKETTKNTMMNIGAKAIMKTGDWIKGLRNRTRTSAPIAPGGAVPPPPPPPPSQFSPPPPPLPSSSNGVSIAPSRSISQISNAVPAVAAPVQQMPVRS